MQTLYATCKTKKNRNPILHYEQTQYQISFLSNLFGLNIIFQTAIKTIVTIFILIIVNVNIMKTLTNIFPIQQLKFKLYLFKIKVSTA